MSRRGKTLPQLGVPTRRSGGSSSSPTAHTPSAPPLQSASPTPLPARRSSDTSSPTGHTPPAPPLQSASPTPRPTGPWLPGCGVGSGPSYSSHGNQTPNPWGGYFNFLQQPHFSPPPQQLGENFHFVGCSTNQSPPSPAPPPYATETRTEKDNIETTGDDGGLPSRHVKKRFWTHDEEVKLASAWLNTSKDPVHGNDKKSDSFWGQITEEFNKNTLPANRRDTNQLKCHWSSLSKSINELNGFWTTVCKMNKSGYSDDQLMDDAQARYQKKNGKSFALVHWWKILKNEPKWCAYVARSEKEKSKTINIDGTDDSEERPIGRESAKTERKGKRKAEQVMDGIVLLGDNITKIIAVTEERKKEREKVTEAQLEISRMNLQAANAQKESKLIEAYNSLLSRDTSQMSKEAKLRHEKALEMMEKKLFGTFDEA